jgi:hypothetical protein
MGRILNRFSIGRLPPQPNVLYDILGFRRTSQHAVGDAEQTRTDAGESRKAFVVFAGFCPKANGRRSLWFLCHCDWAYFIFPADRH